MRDTTKEICINLLKEVESDITDLIDNREDDSELERYTLELNKARSAMKYLKDI